MTVNIAFVNGEYVRAEDARVSASDLAVLRGYGIFESLRTYGGIPFKFEEHLDRLQRSADLVGLKLAWNKSYLENVVAELLKRNRYREASIRIVVTGGESGDLFTPSGKPGLIIHVRPLRTYPQEFYELGVKVATTEMERFLPEAKTINYIPGVIAMQRAKAKDPEIVEVLYIDCQGRVTEGVTSNVFVFDGVTLRTPGEEILFGVTRQLVLDLASKEFRVDVGQILVADLLAADEVFLTGSVKEIMPVRSIDNRPIGESICGPNTRTLIEAYRKMIGGLTP